MKPRPPSLRQRRRYVLALLEPRWCSAETKALHAAILEAATSLWGDAAVARMQPAVVFLNQGMHIIRCRRNREQDLILALSTITEAGGQRVALRPRLTSGTILALKRRMAARGEAVRQEDLTWKGKAYTVYRYEQKVDLIEKGMKGQNLIFLTEHDIEEF